MIVNNDIKEIINDLQRVADGKYYPEDILCGSIAQEWVDYITNLQCDVDSYKTKYENAKENLKVLQEEVNKLTAESTEWESKYYDLEKLNNANYLSFIDCNSRINKVIEYIKENEKEYGSLEDNEKIILNILEGVGKE